MKKIFTILVSTVCAFSIAADTTVTVVPNGTICTLTVGDVTLDNVPVTTQNNVNIAAVNREGVSALVRYTDATTVVADGTLHGAAFHYVSQAAVTHAATFQIPNSNFEAWDAPTASGEPNYWHGFKSAKGLLSGFAKGTLGKSTEVREGAAGSFSAVISSGSTWGVINNGTMTNGQLQAASTTANDPANHSEMSSDNPNFYTALNAAPDAIATWIKFSQGSANSTYPYATLSAIAFDGSYYQDPEDKTYTNVAAKAQNKTIATGDWRLVNIPFNYTGTVDKAKAILVTVSTNATPGQGSNGDQVWIDDMALVYNAGVTAITATGLDGITFDAATHDYAITYSGDPLTLTADNFDVTTDGRAAMIVKAVEDLGDGNYSIVLGACSADLLTANLYTITVTREDIIPVVPGDLNGDGAVDVEDVNAIINLILDKVSPNSLKGNPDLDNSGSTDIGDVNTLINIILAQ